MTDFPITPQHKDIARVFKLLGDTGRLHIVLACMESPKAVCCLAEMAGMSQSLASHHLKSLREARILKSSRHGKQILYSLDDDHIRHMLTDLIDHIQHIKEEQEKITNALR